MTKYQSPYGYFTKRHYYRIYAAPPHPPVSVQPVAASPSARRPPRGGGRRDRAATRAGRRPGLPPFGSPCGRERFSSPPALRAKHEVRVIRTVVVLSISPLHVQ
ncbi:unnamed protein product [Ostreobium quekettii]|uniref:Uncharacterized protein n=1 Tax=Ostreobium quekettii TaxID=121088 RepID=A0A8S1J945_9CHLO|nr:unnamed protein product [Ostreobium quekettii]